MRRPISQVSVEVARSSDLSGKCQYHRFLQISVLGYLNKPHNEAARSRGSFEIEPLHGQTFVAPQIRVRASSTSSQPDHITPVSSNMANTVWMLFIKRPLFGVAFLGTLILIAVWQVKRYVRARRYKLPPSIPGIPVFGNTFQLPPLKQGVWAIEMAKQYGEM